MAIKLSGMISGMDTDAMIDELVNAYSVRKDSYIKEQKALEYKQDAWKDMNSKIYSLFSGKLSSLRFSSNYAIKSVKSTNDGKVTVSGSSTAVNGTQELKITSLAKSGYLTGGVLATEEGADVKGATKLSELGVTSGRINVTVEGKESYIDINENMTVNEFVAALKDKGLNASFDENNQRFFISAKESGAEHDFSLNGNDATGTEVLKKLGLYTVSTADIAAYQEYIDAAADADYITNLAKNEYLNSLINGKVSSLNEERKTYTDKMAENNKAIAEENKKKSFAALSDEDKDKKITELNDKIKTLQDKIKEEEAKLAEAEANGEEVNKATLDGLNEELKALQDEVTLYGEIKTALGSSEAEDFKTKLEEYNKGIDATIEEYNTLNADLAKVVEGVDEKIKTAQGQLTATIEDKEKYLADNAIAVDYDGADYAAIEKKYTDKLAYANDMVDAYSEYEELVANDGDATRIAELESKLGLVQDETGATRISGADAKIILNGAVFESNTNNFQINGLTITAHGLTDEDETISVTTATDVEGIYNMVKDFFKEYNELMKAMETGYNAASAGDYEPLTDEEMEAMTDKQIEKWETKVKDAVLRKDSTLSSIINLVKTNMSKSFSVDGENLSLASFGIKTLGYFNAEENERGLYHIDGDPDDAQVSGNADKLKEAIANDPDRFISFFSQLTENMYTQLNGKMRSSSLSSAYTVYNDKYMKKQYEDYEDDISDWEDKIDAMREKYEKQFAAMETALSQLQSQSSYFSSMLGY